MGDQYISMLIVERQTHQNPKGTQIRTIVHDISSWLELYDPTKCKKDGSKKKK